MVNKRASKPSSQKPPSNSKKPLGPKRAKTKSKKLKTKTNKIHQTNENTEAPQVLSAPQQLSFFLDKFQSANAINLSSLELESFKDTCILELHQDLGQDIKKAFSQSWKQDLCEGQLVKGKIDPGNPAVLFISTSALRCLDLLKGVRSLTGECHAAKLFSKHMKVEEQVSLLRNRVNIASGTPSRIKKLIDIDALGLSRLAVIVLDIHTDVKGYSLFTLPQVRDEFWDLYKNCFHQRLMQGDLRICLHGPIPNGNKEFKGKKKKKKVLDE